MTHADLELRRQQPAHGGIIGELYLNGRFFCYTLERAAVAIPADVYEVLLNISPKFRKLMPLLVSARVPASWGVRMHTGTRPEHSDACVLVGLARMPNRASIYKTVEAFELLMQRLVGFTTIGLTIR
jgi:hypothetical protein